MARENSREPLRHFPLAFRHNAQSRSTQLEQFAETDGMLFQNAHSHFGLIRENGQDPNFQMITPKTTSMRSLSSHKRARAGLKFSPDPADPAAGSGRIRTGFETAGPAPIGRLAARLRLAWPGLEP
jgi:hypothetical protein